MEDQYKRTKMLLGADSVERLREKRVAVFGVGGVGGYVVEALARSGIGTLDIIDDDVISVSNINRQIIALHSTVGKAKVDVAKERVFDIDPDTVVNAHRMFYSPETAERFDLASYDYIVDAVDTVSAKISLAVEGMEAGVPVISSMGTGNKLSPELFRVADIYETSVCPLARVMRRELRKRGVERLKVVYSEEEPIKNPGMERIPGSTAFVPPVAGLIIAAEVVKDLTGSGK